MIQEILMQFAPSLAGLSLTTVLSIILFRIAKAFFKKKIDEIGENSEFEKVHKEIKEVKNEILEIRGKPHE